MSRVLVLLDRIPLTTLALIAATIGLAPFVPEPHVWEKLKMLAAGALREPIDMFDLALHGLPWLVLGAKLVRMVAVRSNG